MAYSISRNAVSGLWEVVQDGKIIGRGSAPIDAVRATVEVSDMSVDPSIRSDLLTSARVQQEQLERELTIQREAATAAGTKTNDDPKVKKATETSAGNTTLSPAEVARLAAGGGRGTGEGLPVAIPGEGIAVATGQGVLGTTTVSSSTDQALSKQKSTAGRPNPLDAYTNYIYGISLHVIPRNTYNTLVGGEQINYVPKGTVLIASGGRASENFSFLEYFNKADFYFENLKFDTVIGMNSQSRGTNVVSLSFTIVEPIGMTLLNRLLLTAKKFGFYNWGQMPFMLQLDFFGNTDSGEPVKIEAQTKYIPIKLIDCKIKVSTRGAEYQCTAVPFSHQAFTEMAASSPASFEVHADTVENFFGQLGEGQGNGTWDKRLQIQQTLEDNARSAQEALERDRQVNGRDANLAKQAIKKASDDANAVGNTVWRVNSFAAALNSNQKQLVERKYQNVDDEYHFVINEKIAKSKLVLPQKNPTRQSSMKKVDEVEARRATLGKSNATIETKEQAITINAGTSIIDIINLVVRHSEYITNQIKSDKPNSVEANKYIDWFKITCKIELKDFDVKRQIQAKKITYFIDPYKYYNTKFPEAAKGYPTTWEKNYEYSYTGKNQSVIDFNLDFNVMFFTAMTAMRESSQALERGPDDNQKNIEESEAKAAGDRGQGTVAPNQIRILNNNNSVSLAAGKADKANAAANDLHNSIMTTSRGDMINVRLKIAGDPEMIKQDDVYFNSSAPPTSIQNNNGSLIMDVSEIFANLLFKIPTDIDQETGLVTFDTINAQGQILGDNVFNGVYKIIRVENNFDRGMFTQNLDLIRLFGQDSGINRARANDLSQDQREQTSDAQEQELELLSGSENPYSASESTLESPPVTNENSATAPGAESVVASSVQQSVDELRRVFENAGEASIDTQNNGQPWVFDGYRG